MQNRRPSTTVFISNPIRLSDAISLILDGKSAEKPPQSRISSTDG